MNRLYGLWLVAVLAVLIAVPAGARGSRESGGLIDPDEAYDMARSGDAVLVDVRDEAAYTDGHLAGAILAPLASIGAAADELAAHDRTIITYCSCPNEETSVAAADELIARGVADVLVLRGGIQGWVRAGLPVRSGARP